MAARPASSTPGLLIQRQLLIGPKDQETPFSDAAAVREKAEAVAGANPISTAELVRMAGDKTNDYRFDDWAAAVAETAAAEESVEEKSQYSKKFGPYTYKYKSQDPKGQNRLEVYAADEAEPVGYAMYRIEEFASKDAPAPNTIYGKEDVLARAGKVAHLTHFYNTTLGRDGPADIYAGFGTALLKKVEKDAKAAGARMMYLEAAGSPVRQDPNTKEKKTVESETFYAKFQYGTDLDAMGHNWTLALKEIQGIEMDDETRFNYIQKRLSTMLEGMMSKILED